MSIRALDQTLSPEIGIQGLNATSMAVIVDDPDAAAGSFTHWIIWNIPPMDVIPGAIPKNATVNKPISAMQGMTLFRRSRIRWPLPASGKTAQVLSSASLDWTGCWTSALAPRDQIWRRQWWATCCRRERLWPPMEGDSIILSGITLLGTALSF